MSWLKGWLTGGTNELGWDDLISGIAGAIAGRRQFGRQGDAVFAAELRVIVVAPAQHIDVLRQFVAEPDLDRCVQANVANRCDCALDALPLCSYQVTEGPAFDVRVEERHGASVWHLEIEGGDRSGARLAIPAGQREIRFGRSEWHGGDAQIRNDLIVSEKDPFVSRRAGRLLRAGHGFEVEAADQGDFLVVHRHDAGSLRPARCASGRVALRAGDAIELSSGEGQSVRLVVRRGSE